MWRKTLLYRCTNVLHLWCHYSIFGPTVICYGDFTFCFLSIMHQVLFQINNDGRNVSIRWRRFNLWATKLQRLNNIVCPVGKFRFSCLRYYFMLEWRHFIIGSQNIILTMYMKYNKNFLHDHIVSVFDSAMSCEYLIVLKSSESQIFLCENMH